MALHICITGAGSGIGAELAQQYLDAGAKLLLLDRQFPEGKESLYEHQRVNYATIDVRDIGSIKDAMAGQLEFDRIIHCAAIGSIDPFEKVAPEVFHQVIDVNLNGSFNFAHVAIKHIKKGGHLALVSSLGGLVTNHSYTSYSASKFGVVALAEILRMELKPKGIRVQLVCPPEIETPMVVEERARISAVSLKLKHTAGVLELEEGVRQIRKGIESGRYLVIPGFKAKVVYLLSRWVPIRLYHWHIDRTIAKAL